MRLSEERINFIAEQMVAELMAKKLVKYTGSRVILEAEMARVIIEDLRIEEKIEGEVVEMIANMKRRVPQGSSEWQAIFSQLKEEVAKRHNYVY